jgi:hypothetical protein
LDDDIAILDELYAELVAVEQAHTEQRIDFGRINGDAMCTTVPKDDSFVRVEDDGAAVSEHSLASLVEFEIQFLPPSREAG